MQGDAIDTFVLDTHFVVSSGYLVKDTAYDFLELTVLAINGPAPDTWGIYPSLGKTGLLFAIRHQASSATPTTSPYGKTTPGIAKRAVRARTRHSLQPEDIVRSFFSKRFTALHK